MSKADKMFEELGYKKFEGLRQIEYHNKNYVIVFEKDTKVFYCSKDEYEDYITMQELKAINQKVLELRVVKKMNDIEIWKDINRI